MKTNGKRFLLVCGTAFMSLALAACGGNNGGDGSKKLTVCIASEPQSIDPALNSAVDGATMLVHLESGLYRYQQANDGSVKLTYDLASDVSKKTATVVDHVYNDSTESWDAVTYNNGVQYTVTLRDGIKWSDGTPITTDDFIYSWNRASGSTLGADYGYMFECIADGYAHECDDSSFPSLGINKINDKKFTVDLMVDVSYLDQLFAFPTYFPVKQSVVETNDAGKDPGTWATDPSTYVSCGAYTLDSWTHNSSITLKKNPNYWDAANIKIDEITFALSDDDAAILASYQAGEYQLIDSVPNDQIDELKAAYPDEFVIAGQMGTYYISFNVNSKLGGLTNESDLAKFRKALGLLVDRQYIVEEIGKAGQISANAFVSAGLSDAAGGEFVDHNGVNRDGAGYYNKGETDSAYQANVAEAIQILKGLGFTYDDSTKKFTHFPTFEYLYNNGSGHKAIAEFLKDTWEGYGIPCNLRALDWAEFLEVRKEGQYDVARNGWVADYDDPSSYLTMWTTASGNNDCQFGKGAHKDVAIYSADINRDGTKETGLTWAQSYDYLVDLSNKESDPVKRFALLHEIEDLLMETGAICPIYYYTDIYMINSNIDGFFSTPLGYKFFMYCEVK